MRGKHRVPARAAAAAASDCVRVCPVPVVVHSESNFNLKKLNPGPTLNREEIALSEFTFHRIPTRTRSSRP
eukprot:1213847-Rhodomonas_salina.1